MNTSRVERDLEASKARNLRNINILNSIINMLNEENEELESEIKRLKEENAQHKENCCCFENEKLRLDLNNAKDLLKECYNKFARYQVEGDEPTYQENIEICDKIDAALGESEECWTQSLRKRGK